MSICPSNEGNVGGGSPSRSLPEEFYGNGAPPMNLHTQPDERSLADAVTTFERHMIERALDEANGVQTRAAEALGTTRRILKYRMGNSNSERKKPVR